MINRTPPRTRHPSVAMPSGKLCAVTRKRNDIESMLSSSAPDRETIVKLYGEFLQKVEILMNECQKIIADDPAAGNTVTDWLKPHEDNINEFRSRMQYFIEQSAVNEGAQASNTNVDARQKSSSLTYQPVQVQARALSPDRESIVSKTASSIQSNSAARVKLAERKAQLSAEKLYQSKLRIIEEEELRTRMLKKTLELEKEEAETSILQSELDKLDGIASELENIPDMVFTNIKISDTKSTFNAHEKLPRPKFNSSQQGARPKCLKNLEETLPLYPQHSDSRPTHLLQESCTNSRPQNMHPLESTVDVNSLAKILEHQNDISLRLVKNQERTALPKRELKPFDGSDITQYRRFITNFFLLVHNKCDSSAECLHYLEQYTEGSACELVRSVFDLSPEIGYENALALLEEEFGNEYRVANTYLEKLENWPPIKSEDSKGLNELSIFLMTCKSNMTTMSVLNQLNSPKQIRSIVMKMPYRIREKWRELTLELIDGNHAIDFAQLVSFTRKQSRLLSQPLFGDIKDSQSYQIKKSAKVFLTQENENYNDSEYLINNSTKKKYSDIKFENTSCVFCKQFNHNVKQCINFSKLSYERRIEIIRETGMCFSCLDVGHFSRNCKNKLLCDICNKLHPTALHNHDRASHYPQLLQSESPKTMLRRDSCAPGNTTSTFYSRNYSINTGAGKSSRVVCPVVPVKVKVHGKNKFITTNAVLDSGSSACFMDYKLLKNLGIKSTSSNISITTMTKDKSRVSTKVVNNLELYSLTNERKDIIPVVFAQELWPFDEKDLPSSNSISREDHLRAVPFSFIDASIGLLIGMNRPEMLKPLEVVSGPVNSPYASRHHLGWALNGPLNEISTDELHCHRTLVDRAHLNEIEREIKTMYDQDYIDFNDSNDKVSLDDMKWLDIVQKSICIKDGHYQVDLPFKEKHPSLQCNKNQIYFNFVNLKKRFERDFELFKHYSDFMNMMYERGYMIKVTGDNNKKWYLNHHGVFHKEKGKLRVVFNCALKYKGKSLNDVLLQGPDFTNNLLGVLLKFREGKVAFLGDIEKMYYQVKIPQHQQDYLRLFWFENSDLNGNIIEFKLTVHLFGAVSSPAVCNYALKQTVEEGNVCEYIKSVVKNNFYVDDLLCSSQDEITALDALNKTKVLLSKSGFNLTQFASNSRYIINSLPKDEIAKTFKTLDLVAEQLPNERALGLVWNTEKDHLLPKLNLTPKPLTRRGMLSVIHSIYDPLGLVNPAIVPAKVMFQETCRLKLDWNETLPDYIITKWTKWINSLQLLLTFSLPRCVQSVPTRHFEIHYFSDGSELAYGSVAYCRVVADEKLQVCLLLSKSRLTPLNNCALKTIPRIELNAAKLSVTLQQTLRKELLSKIHREYFWTDSSTVLSYIKNDNKRFQRFVSNRISFIRSNTSPEQWRYVPSTLNPADVISRGTDVEKFIKSTTWINGPQFLHLSPEQWPEEPETNIHINKDPEVISAKIRVQVRHEDSTKKLFQSCSDLYKLKCRIAWLSRFKSYLQKNIKRGPLTLEELTEAEQVIWQYVQEDEFGECLRLLTNNRNLPKNSKLQKLSPFVEGNVMRVGGRIEKSSLPYNTRFPIILPNRNPIVKLLIEEIHKRCGHMGREVVISHLRRKYWVIGVNKFVRYVVNNCMNCRKLKGKPNFQKMAALPVERVTGDSPPFHSTGIDFFGPYSVTNGRKVEKRYGVVFTCLASRAIHLEMANSLDTSSFINAFRRFRARRGTVTKVRSDNGTNLTAGEKEMKMAITSWNKTHIEQWMKQRNIEWTFNPPCAPHFGGIWEREVKSIKSVMNSVLNEQHLKLSDENLNTLLCEIESILNSRPLTQLTDDPDDLEPLTPNHLLLLDNFATFPPGLFSCKDHYHNRRWKQVQYLADLFWTRWRRQYLPLLQSRQRWPVKKKSLKVNDLVLIVDNLLPRNQWNVGRITEVFPDSNNEVRVVSVKLAKHKNGSMTKFGTQEFKRPVTKLVLLRCSEDL